MCARRRGDAQILGQGWGGIDRLHRALNPAGLDALADKDQRHVTVVIPRRPVHHGNRSRLEHEPVGFLRHVDMPGALRVRIVDDPLECPGPLETATGRSRGTATLIPGCLPMASATARSTSSTSYVPSSGNLALRRDTGRAGKRNWPARRCRICSCPHAVGDIGYFLVLDAAHLVAEFGQVFGHFGHAVIGTEHDQRVVETDGTVDEGEQGFQCVRSRCSTVSSFSRLEGPKK